MERRLQLQAVLESVLGADSVYFQPPENIQMVYPAIVYGRDSLSVRFADNSPYFRMFRYQVTVIDPNPDSPLHEKLSGLPLTTYVRHFVADSLNHDIYNVYF